MLKMQKWKCPKCSHEVEAKATVVCHRCRWNKNLMTNYEMVEK